jgi:hypothetical protein
LFIVADVGSGQLEADERRGEGRRRVRKVFRRKGGDQVPTPPKVTDIGLQIFAITNYKYLLKIW